MGELRELYPNIKATSKKDFIAKVNEQVNDIEVIDEEVVEVDKSVYDAESGDLTWYNTESFIMQECRGNKKILVKTPTTIEADLIWARISQEIFPKLHDQDVQIMASSTRRDMHLNGTCYIRFVCHTNYEHIKRILPYTHFKVLT